MTPSEKRKTALVLGSIAVLFLAFLGSVGIFDPEEGRHVSIPVAMLRTGDFLVPHLQGFPYLEKPPLTYWMTAASFAALGRSEFAARLPAAVMAFLGTLAIFWLAHKRLGIRTAWIAALLSALTTQWFIQARYLTTDMFLAGWMTVALSAFLLAATGGPRHLYLLAYGGMGLATLSKGIIGFLLPGLIIGGFIAWTGRWRLLREMRLVSGTLLMAAMVLPWFLSVQARLPDFLRYFIFDQHVSRFAGEAAEHAKPFWFFLPVVFFGFFPWVAYLPFRPGADARSAGHGRVAGARPEIVFLYLWCGVIFLFFSISRGKLLPYILPAYPPLAILVAERFSRLGDPSTRTSVARIIRRRSWIVAGIYLLLAPTSFALLLRLSASDGRVALEDVGAWAWALVGLFGLGGAALLILSVLRRPAAGLVGLAVTHLAFYGVALGVARAVDPLLGPGTLGRTLAQRIRPEDEIILYELQQPSMEFYLDRVPKLVNWAGEYEYGMTIQPDPDLFYPYPASIRDLMDTERNVYVLVKRKDRSMPEGFGVPVRPVAQNRRRVLYRNHPERP